MSDKPLFDWLEQRSSGVLMHPTSLPGTQGIGVLGEAVDDWLDFLAAAGIRYWQTCPLGPTGFGDSPYQCFSAFAGNPYLIDLKPLLALGLLEDEDLLPLAQLPQDSVDYGALYEAKWPVLFKAFAAWQGKRDHALPWGDFTGFRQKQKHWLDGFALFMAIKDIRSGEPWWMWPEELRFFSRVDQDSLPAEVHERAEAHAFFQYLFFGQWHEVRRKAHLKGVEIIGDAPIFVASDSADVWSHPELFQIDQQSGRPLKVAGVPPDYFSLDGQLWGNPLYDWGRHAETGFAWWLSRLRANFEICDVLRIDHFRAFDTYWSIPAEATTARNGQWMNGPGLAFFEAIRQDMPRARLIAEDLGDLFPSVNELREATGLPGMAILQFAFGGESDNPYLPHNLKANCVLYPGTHDNDTTQGWYQAAPDHVRHHVRHYLRIGGQDISWDLIRACYESVCNLTIIPLQDLLNLDSKARFNTPGKAQGNWQWRYREAQLQHLHHHSAASLQELGLLHGRIPTAMQRV